MGKREWLNVLAHFVSMSLLSNLGVSDVYKKGRERHREKTRKRKKGRVFWEKGEKEKQPLQKPKHTNQKTTLFSLFFFSL